MSATTYSATPRDWIQAARPHTWPNAFAPVLAGTGAALYQNSGKFVPFFLALIVSWALVIGVNYANDYSDGIRGTDDERTGPTRLTASKLARPADVKKAAFISFGVASVAGLILALLSAWWLILVGAVCLAGAWFYTRTLYPVRLLSPYIVTFVVGILAFPATWIAFISGYWTLKALHRVNSGARGRQLVTVLALTGRAMALWSGLMFIALALA